MGIEREKPWLPSETVQHHVDVLGGYSADVSQAVKEPVGEKSATILQKMQRSVISSTLNIARSFKFLLKQRGLLLSDLFLGQNFIIVY